jgi:ribosome-associated protein
MAPDEPTPGEPTHDEPGPDEAAFVVAAARAADAKSGRDTVVLDVGPVLAITSWFVITSAPNSRAVRAIVDNVEEEVARVGGPRPTAIEGRDTWQWVLMRYPDFVVHVFDEETRAYYELERLWRDVPTVDWAAAPGTA